VTGSKHLLTCGEQNILVDCGLFQGLKNLREQNWSRLSIEPKNVDAVVLTHAHLDHCGYLPRLVKDGFRGKIYSTPATKDVAELILKDSAYLQEKDADFLNRHKLTSHQPALPLYKVRDAEKAIGHFSTADFNQTIRMPNGALCRFRYAGHILGAANVTIEWGGKRVAFSGDIGRYGNPILPDPAEIHEADYVVIESTYGNRVHDTRDPADMLQDIAIRTTNRGGTLIIPAFAVGRAQELIYYLWLVKQRGHLKNVPIYLDSPMAIDATALLGRHMSDHKLNAQLCKDIYTSVKYTDDVESSKAITASKFPKIIISASGMATGGRVLHHMAAFGPDSRNTVLLSGFQAAGTRGRVLQDGARELKIHGAWIPINAEVAEIDSLSAHADSNELLRWLKGFARPPQQIFIVHGEPEASEALRVRIKREIGWNGVVPRQDQEFVL